MYSAWFIVAERAGRLHSSAGFTASPANFHTDPCHENLHINGLSTNYYLHRTEVMRNSFKYAEEVDLPALGTELLICCLSMIVGKGKICPFITSLQQANNPDIIFPRTNKKGEMPTFFQIMLRDDWPQQYKLFKQYICQELEIMGTDKDKADSVFDQEFCI